MNAPPDLPSDDELLDLVRQWPGICLRELCALLWPSLSWLDASRDPLPGAAPAPTLAIWVRDRMRTLIGQGRVQLAPFCQRQPENVGI